MAKATETKKRYCEKFNYDFLLCETLLDRSRPAGWSKFLLIAQNLRNYEAVFLMDADAMIIDHSRSIEQVFGDLIEDRTKDLILVRDWVGNINTGVFWLRNTPWSHKLLGKLHRQTDVVPTRAGKWDNPAFIRLYESDRDISAKTCVLSTRMLQINCYPHLGEPITRDTFVLHFAGTPDLERLRRWIEHYSDKDYIERIWNYFWYPIFRATLLRRVPGIVRVYRTAIGTFKPSPAVAESLVYLAWLYFNRGNCAEARALHRRSLMILEKTLGPGHPSLAESLEDYATLLMEAGEGAKVAEIAARAKAIRARHVKENPTG